MSEFLPLLTGSAMRATLLAGQVALRSCDVSTVLAGNLGTLLGRRVERSLKSPGTDTVGRNFTGNS